MNKLLIAMLIATMCFSCSTMGTFLKDNKETLKDVVKDLVGDIVEEIFKQLMSNSPDSNVSRYLEPQVYSYMLENGYTDPIVIRNCKEQLKLMIIDAIDKKEIDVSRYVKEAKQ